MAPMLPWIIGAGVGMQAIGTLQAGQAAAAEAKSRQAMAEYNAKVAEQEAKAAEAQTQFQQKRQAEAALRQQGRLRAGLGAAGVVTTEGTPLMIQAKQAAEAELEGLMIGYEGQIRAGRARSQAALDRLQGSIYGQRAKTASRGGFMGAGTSLLTGFGEMGLMYKKGYLP
ncbi:MAG TPA: hypothetical protein VMY37_37905 [Thermoguttaceae bacterium]|nr:hypothetical protein [Thermoguttaceae bacterium]